MASLDREMRARSAWAPGAAITGHLINGLSSATAPDHSPIRIHVYLLLRLGRRSAVPACPRLVVGH